MNSLDLEFIQELYQSLYVNRKTITDVTAVSEVDYKIKEAFTEQDREYEHVGNRSNKKWRICCCSYGWWSRHTFRL